MKNKRSHSQRSSRHRGFTLVELLAALGISLLLIAAITSSLDIYVRLTSTGEIAVERQQVTRALLQQMTRDVSSIVFAAPEEEEAEDGMTAEEPEVAVMEIEDTESAIAGSSVGLIGDSQTLVLHVSRPSRNLGYSSPLTASSLDQRTSDLLSVSYFLASPGGGDLRGVVGDNASYDTTTGSSDGVGLARLEGDRMAIDHADLEMSTDLLASAATLIAPEVVSLQFQYFDGTLWLETWDSTIYGALPQAIEVTIGFRNPPEVGSDSDSVRDSDLTIDEYVRHVIHVSIAEPYSASSTY